jgi:N-methylhydantoinase A
MEVTDLPAGERGVRQAYDFTTGGMRDFALVRRGDLRPGDAVAGPAIVDEGTSTTVIFSDQALRVDRFGHLIVTPVEASG